MDAIFACSYTGVMGRNGTIPWKKNTNDLQWFKSITENNAVVMGRKTYDDVMMPKPLKNRLNYVVTSNKIDSALITSIQYNDIFEIDRQMTDIGKTLYVIGGPNLLSSLRNHINKIHVNFLKYHGNGVSIDMEYFFTNHKIITSMPTTFGTLCTFERYNGKRDFEQ